MQTEIACQTFGPSDKLANCNRNSKNTVNCDNEVNLVLGTAAICPVPQRIGLGWVRSQTWAVHEDRLSGGTWWKGKGKENGELKFHWSSFLFSSSTWWSWMENTVDLTQPCLTDNLDFGPNSTIQTVEREWKKENLHSCNFEGGVFWHATPMAESSECWAITFLGSRKPGSGWKNTK